MDFLTTRGKILVGGIFILLILSTALSSFAALVMMNRNHELEEQNECYANQIAEMHDTINKLKYGEVK
jgi:hypothetical protein